MEILRRRALQKEQLEHEASKEDEEEEDTELWADNVPLVQIPVGQKSYNEQLHILRRTTSEVTLGFVTHAVCLVYCIAVNVYDSTSFKKCEDPLRFYAGYNTFGGRFKYLTYITMVSHVTVT